MWLIFRLVAVVTGLIGNWQSPIANLLYSLRFSKTENCTDHTEVTLIKLQQKLKRNVEAAALELFGVELEQIPAETPPKTELGDLAFPVAFELAKRIKQGTGVKLAPRAIAEQLKTRLEADEEVERVEVAGAGYLNVFFNRATLLRAFASAPVADGDS